MARHKTSDYGRTWWDCNYCKLSHSILKQELPCGTCAKRNLHGATPTLLDENWIPSRNEQLIDAKNRYYEEQEKYHPNR